MLLHTICSRFYSTLPKLHSSRPGSYLLNMRDCLLALALVLFVSGISSAALPSTDGSGRALPSLAPMLKTVNPAVVNISTFATRENVNPLLSDPFFRRFFDIPERRYRQRRQQSAGSGVIVDKDDGIVLTNYHVIQRADEIHVGLLDGRSFEAKLLGTDPELDIAVLKIEARELTEVKLADSDRLQVGDFVVAIGNPFGLGQTVTTGIVSALGRSGLGIEGYENFIQTDASINPGNSGGALVNLAGELVGINTAIIAPAGGNVGIGFAIPSNMANASMVQLVKFGEVRRGRFGINTQEINKELREAFNLPNGQSGVLITGVAKGSAAEKAGLSAGDIITAIDDKPTRSNAQLRSQIGIKAVGEVAKVEVLREGDTRTFQVKVGDFRSQLLASLPDQFDGVALEDNKRGDGIAVTEVAPRSQAAYAGLREGDIIVAFNRQRVQSLEDLAELAQRPGRQYLLHIFRDGQYFYVVL